MNKKIVIAFVAIGLIIVGIYAIINVANKPTTIVEKTTTSLYGKWKLDTSHNQQSSFIDSTTLYATELNFENDSAATLNLGKDSLIQFAYTKTNDTLVSKNLVSKEKKFVYKWQDSLLQLRYVKDSSILHFVKAK